MIFAYSDFGSQRYDRMFFMDPFLIARLPQESQGAAFEQCWRKDWQDKEPHLLPAKHVAAWIQASLYLSLADAPFNREDSTLNPTAGACVTCPRRSGHNTSLFDDVQGDQCLDSACYHGKVEAFLDREIAAHPRLMPCEAAKPACQQHTDTLARDGIFRSVSSARQIELTSEKTRRRLKRARSRMMP